MLLSGCQWTSPITTSLQYAPSDGTQATVGQVEFRNVALISNKGGGPATLIGSALNNGDQPAQVTFAAGSAQAAVTVPPGQLTQLSTEGKLTKLNAVASAPGAMEKVLIRPAGSDGLSLNVPVLASFPPYAQYAPDGSTPPPPAKPEAPAEGGH